MSPPSPPYLELEVVPRVWTEILVLSVNLIPLQLRVSSALLQVGLFLRIWKALKHMHNK